MQMPEKEFEFQKSWSHAAGRRAALQEAKESVMRRATAAWERDEESASELKEAAREIAALEAAASKELKQFIDGSRKTGKDRR